jgi:UDP-glucose 4-epimerase
LSVLTISGAGYIGSHMVHEFVDAGEPVVVLDNLSNGFRFLIPASVPFVSGSTGDRTLVSDVIARHGVTAIIHFAASIVVPESVAEPLKYYGNNTVNTCALLDTAVRASVRQFIFSSTAAVYGAAEESPVRENSPTIPISPYGTSKLMSEIMLHDAAKAYGMRFVILRYFNVAGADPRMRTGQATPAATHLIKVACETAIGKRPKLEVFGTDYPTPDGTCIRDYIHVADLVQAHSSSLTYLRSGGASKATSVQATISDPVARKLVEWIILRSDHNGADSKRYLAFIAANPGWPSLLQFRRRAEAMLWVENIKPAQALSFFKDSPPQSGIGRMVLARALSERSTVTEAVASP